MQTTLEHRHRNVTIAVILALILGFLFVRPFLSVIFFAAIMAFLFQPLFRWLHSKTGHAGIAASLTFTAGLFLILIPLALVVIFSVVQVERILNTVTQGGHPFNLNDVDTYAEAWVNNFLLHVPGAPHVTPEQISTWFSTSVSTIAQAFLRFMTSSISSIPAAITEVILFIYVFLNLLRHGKEMRQLLSQLNPLGNEATNLYLQRAGGMTSAMVRGQFVIALAQGFVGALILLIAGIDNLFFFLFMILTLFSIIPLGAGIIIIPIGLVMLITGNVWEGIFVLTGHFLIITNIDNVLRPRLVPKNVHLNSALTMLAVFAGIQAFGFLGVVIGPVIMILITTTIRMYTHMREASVREAKVAPSQTA